jgi:hypothetical protein
MAVLSGYVETMKKFEDTADWDIPGVIKDAADSLKESTDEGAALAVIDSLCLVLQRIESFTKRDDLDLGDICICIRELCDLRPPVPCRSVTSYIAE